MSCLVGTKNEQLILTKFHCRIGIHYNYGEFYIESWYTNTSNATMQTKYVFPSISGIHLSNLSIFTDKTEFQIKIEECQKPLKLYEDAKNAGESVYTLEKLRETNMMSYGVGNVLANSQIAIKAVYVCKTEQISPENYWKFKIPKDLLPNKLENIAHSAEAFIVWKDFPKEHGNFILKKGNSITLDEKQNMATFRNFDPNYDIELIYYFKIPKEPLLIVQKDPRVDRYAFNLSYTPYKELPDLNERGNDGEFVILLDRSGSMASRIKLATEAVALFIRSLPANCYFNVVSFGSRFEIMFNISKKYDKSSADEAHRLVLGYKSDLAGTKLLAPLEYAFGCPRIPGYALHIFVVTDGNVWMNKNEITTLVKKHKNDAKISTIGINTNQPFIDELAKLGNGTSQQINSENQIKPAILSSLKQALVPELSNIQLADYEPFDFVLPKDPFSIFSGEKVEISGVFKNRKLPDSIKLQYEKEGFSQNIELEINQDCIPASSSVFLLETKEYLNRCDRETSVTKSKEYQVEGQFTAFDIERYEKEELPVEIKNAVKAVFTPKKKTVQARNIVPTIKIEKPKKEKQGKLSDREIKTVENTTELLIPKTKFKNIIRTISDGIIPDMRFRKEAIQAFQEAAEAYIVEIFKESANTSANHKRATIRPEDMQQAAIDIQQKAQNQSANISQGRTRSGKVKPKPAEQAKPQSKQAAKNSAPKSMRQITPKKNASVIIATQINTPRTRSASKLADVELQTKRGRTKQAKVIPPRKKAKVEKTEAKIEKIEIQQIENKEKEAIYAPRPQENKEVRCIDIGYEVEKIMHLQNPDGFWESSTNLSEIVNNLIGYDKRVTSYWSKLDEKLTTALIVALLNQKCEDYKCLWELVVMKAKKWLSKNKQRLLTLADF